VIEVPTNGAERLLVCIGPSPSSAELVRMAQKMAADLKAEWFAVYVEDPRMLRLPEGQRSRAVYNLRLAEQLGAEAVTLRGRRIAEEIISFARQRHITRIVVGKPRQWRWQAIFRGSPVDKLVRMSGDIDVEVMAGELGEPPELRASVQPKGTRRPEYELGMLFFILATGLAFLMYPYFELSNLIMVFLVAVMVTAIHCGRGPAILVSVLSVLTFDFCFVPPRWTFDVAETHFIFTFAVMFLVALVISHLTSLIRRQAEAARLQERQTAAMHSFSRELAGTRGVAQIIKVAVKHISEIFACQAAALLPDATGQVRLAPADAALIDKDILKELGIAQWA
jgi:two-component system sensor histidine kinase KdpD